MCGWRLQTKHTECNWIWVGLEFAAAVWKIEGDTDLEKHTFVGAFVYVHQNKNDQFLKHSIVSLYWIWTCLIIIISRVTSSLWMGGKRKQEEKKNEIRHRFKKKTFVGFYWLRFFVVFPHIFDTEMVFYLRHVQK